MGKINRRKFLKSTGGILALSALDLANFNCSGIHEPEVTYNFRAPKGPNERLNVAVIGLGGRGYGSHLSQFNTRGNCQITYVCDADTALGDKAIKKVSQSNGGTDPVFVQDMRKIFDDKDVDIVSIATCNHWHSLAAIWAMQAGKDVYVEKPLSHNISEGRRVVQVAERTKRVLQCGTQMRSNSAIIDSIAFLRGGGLGKIQVSRALCYKARPSIGKVDGPQPIPSGVDYNLWCGPAHLSPLMREKLQYDWHWAWETGNGDIGNQGIHEIDLARWAMCTDAPPRSVQTVGGRFGYVDDGQTPNTQVAVIDYGPGQPTMMIEVRGLQTPAYHSRGVENIIHGEKGIWVSPSYTSAVAYNPDGSIIRRFDGGGDASNFNNFLEVVRSRKVSDLHAPAIDGHLSCIPLHMANISFQVGKLAPFEPQRNDVFGTSKDGNEAMARMVQHLTENKVPLTETKYTLGPKLNFDAASEKFTNSSEANRMLTREYRKPFVVPDRA